MVAPAPGMMPITMPVAVERVSVGQSAASSRIPGSLAAMLVASVMLAIG